MELTLLICNHLLRVWSRGNKNNYQSLCYHSTFEWKRFACCWWESYGDCSWFYGLFKVGSISYSQSPDTIYHSSLRLGRNLRAGFSWREWKTMLNKFQSIDDILSFFALSNPRKWVTFSANSSNLLYQHHLSTISCSPTGTIYIYHDRVE